MPSRSHVWKARHGMLQPIKHGMTAFKIPPRTSYKGLYLRWNVIRLTRTQTQKHNLAYTRGYAHGWSDGQAIRVICWGVLPPIQSSVVSLKTPTACQRLPYIHIGLCITRIYIYIYRVIIGYVYIYMYALQESLNNILYITYTCKSGSCDYKVVELPWQAIIRTYIYIYHYIYSSYISLSYIYIYTYDWLLFSWKCSFLPDCYI